ncbi:hypothetical protein [Kurthia sp. Dielmo]|uniref:hypothetical protein n=1 Tax=Kurthia sp. Dielmo TaxID=1033738 RepID=UPI0011239F36|nr:hypothetical protein [Kurthia sp. Dielmo]
MICGIDFHTLIDLSVRVESLALASNEVHLATKGKAGMQYEASNDDSYLVTEATVFQNELSPTREGVSGTEYDEDRDVCSYISPRQPLFLKLENSYVKLTTSGYVKITEENYKSVAGFSSVPLAINLETHEKTNKTNGTISVKAN